MPLRTALKPFKLHYFPRLRSTNDHAAELRRRKTLFAPAVILTARQTAGRGRGSNTWFSNPGCLTATFALPIDECLAPHHVPLAAGLAVRNAAAELSGDSSISLKWPNDVLHDGLKLAGILCERVHRLDLVGVGLNVNLDPADAPAILRGKMTSLLMIAGRALDMNDTLICLARHLRLTLQRAGEGPISGILREYDRCHALVGRKVRVRTSETEPALMGVCQGLDGMGRLLLKTPGGVERVIAGQVEW